MGQSTRSTDLSRMEVISGFTSLKRSKSKTDLPERNAVDLTRLRQPRVEKPVKSGPKQKKKRRGAKQSPKPNVSALQPINKSRTASGRKLKAQPPRPGRKS